MKIYAYTMTNDTGFAPSVYKNMLSLACCKTKLRYKIGHNFNKEEDTYIIGLCGTGLANSHKYTNTYFPVYIAKVSKVVCTKKYFTNEEFKCRPDVQYMFDGEKWAPKKTNPHQTNYDLKKDIYYTTPKTQKYNYVLLSNEYVYFGDNYANEEGNLLPKCLLKIGVIRKNASRACLGSIDLSTDEEKELKQFLYKNRKQFSDLNTIDDYFLQSGCSRKGCKK